ncbi:MAG: hypothetical protein AAGA43_02190 [Bacteroidota bacterium]
MSYTAHKNIKRQATLIIGLLIVCISQAQESCYTYFPSEIGLEWSYKYYDKRGRLTSSSLHTITVENTGGITVKSISFDEEGEPLGFKNDDGTIEVYEVDYEVFCIDGGLYMPPESVTHSFTELFEGLEVAVSGDNFLVSSGTMDTNTTLPNYYIKMKVNAAALKIEINVSDRRVIGSEAIETPAGTFQCLKIEQKTNTKVGFIRKQNKTIIWVAPGVGMVKSVSYKNNGNVLSKTILERKNW